MNRSKRRNVRRPGSNSTGPKKVGGVLIGAVAVAVVVAMYYFRPEQVPRDPRTMCPDAGPSRVTAIVIDTTDRFAPTSRADILGRLDDLVIDSVADEMMLAYETGRAARPAEQSPARLHPPLIQVCNPGNPDAANPLISSPELIRRRLEDRFRQPLGRLFEELVDGAPAPASPIMETVQAISVEVLARRAYAQIPKHLVLISDLMQHSQHLSLYDGPLDFDGFSATTGASALATNLQDVEVSILFVQRAAHDRFESTLELVRFWESWFWEQGAKVGRVSKVDGLS